MTDIIDRAALLRRWANLQAIIATSNVRSATAIDVIRLIDAAPRAATDFAALLHEAASVDVGSYEAAQGAMRVLSWLGERVAAPRAATEPSERRIVECPHCHEQLSVAGDKAEAPRNHFDDDGCYNGGSAALMDEHHAAMYPDD